jgi:hypothetical protein
MEPRPQRPSRATGPFISTGTPNPPTSSANPGSGTGYGTAPFDASSAPPAPPPAIGYDPDYSPGQPLTPLRGPRGANIVGPLLAVAALAIIVAAVAFIISQFRGGTDNPSSQPTAVIAAAASPTAGQQGDVTGNSPTEAAASNQSGQPTSEAGGAEATTTPKVNRPTETGDLSGSDGTDTSGSSSGEKTRARQWLPTTRIVGEGYEQSNNGTRDVSEVAVSFPNSEEAATKLAEFGWQENVYREYELSGGAETDTTTINVSVHRFDTEGGAKDALSYFAEGGRVGQGLTEVKDAPEFGEGSVVLQGTIDGGNVYVIYIRQNNFVIRIGGFSPTGDPSETTNALAERMMGQ